MAVNKVSLGKDVIIDISGDTVIPSALKTGYTAHGSDGELVKGEYSPSAQSKTVSSGLTTTIVKPDFEYEFLSDVKVMPIDVEEQILENGSTHVIIGGTT